MLDLGSQYESSIYPYMEHFESMVPFFSSVTNEIITSPKALNNEYWRRNLQSPVLFAGAIRQFLQMKGRAKSFSRLGLIVL